ncbi:hypothetical protein FEM48_ZijujUnG0052000 [Ziziphus jujuba var. spinosa]|uniref:Uncharacterized protein n=1 Tax=Ziziphus jujuba var. spinosa TaxID=714518 RepID=A0A978U958_ZIZJJ|nr:hypothetical protein FEM48_ZijujUnG0052000 [Ziziphus jujuba var. spinosa]
MSLYSLVTSNIDAIGVKTPDILDLSTTVYNEVASKGDFEVVFFSANDDEESFNGLSFTTERIKELKDQEEVVDREQSLRSILVSGSSVYVISSSGNKAPVSEVVWERTFCYISLLIGVPHALPSCLSLSKHITASRLTPKASFCRDERKKNIQKKFKTKYIHAAIAIASSGLTVNEGSCGDHNHSRSRCLSIHNREFGGTIGGNGKRGDLRK